MLHGDEVEIFRGGPVQDSRAVRRKTQNPAPKQSPTNTGGLPFTPTSDPRTRNPETGIQTPAALMNTCAWWDIRTQNPESGIRKPDRPASRTCASVQGRSEPRTRNPESGNQIPAAFMPHVCMAVQPRAFKGHQNPDPRSQKPEPRREPACRENTSVDSWSGIWILNSGFSHLLEGSV